MASSQPFPRIPHIAATDVELGTRLGSGANCAVYDAFVISTGQRFAAKIYNSEHGSSAQDKIQRVLKAEAACDGANGASLLVCAATCGGGGGGGGGGGRGGGGAGAPEAQALLYRRMDGTLDTQFKLRCKTLTPHERMREMRLAARELFVALHHLHSRDLCHGDVHVQNALESGTVVLLADLESVKRIATETDKEYDLVAAGHVMAQLIVSAEGNPLESYPGSDESKRRLRDDLEKHVPPRAYAKLVDEALKLCGEQEAAEMRDGVSPTSRAFLASVLRQASGSRDLVPTVKVAWELLTRSSSFHGPVSAGTELDVCNATQGTSLIFLDRHTVYVRDYCSALAAFRLVRRGTPDKIAFDFERRRYPAAASLFATEETHLSEDKVLQAGDGGGLIDLAGIRVYVPDSLGRRCFLRGFKLERCPPIDPKSPVRFRFWSLAVPADSAAAVVEAYTAWDDAGPGAERGSLFYLDRHAVAAPEGCMLKGFELEVRASGVGKQVRFKFWYQAYKGSS